MPFPKKVIRAGLIAGLAVMIGSTSAAMAAQPVPPPVLAWPGLTQGDIDRMHAAAARLYEGRSIGTVERWRSPTTKNAGEDKLVRSFVAAGMECRTIDYLIRFDRQRGQLDHYVLNWCQVSPGTWRIVEVAPQQ